MKRGTKKFDFSDLFIFELSKNHGGNVAHGKRTVRAFAKVAREAGVRAAMKLQFQDLDTYLHPSLLGRDDPRVKRYLASRLSEAQFQQLVDEIHAEGLISMSTPFDEPSVEMLVRLGVEVVKIASSSAADWPLLARVAHTGKPVVCSTGGLTFEQMDAVYDFFKKRGVHFSMLHCVSMYPTPPEHMRLHAIALMKERYPDVPIGFSTHEPSDALEPVQIAYALGARIFEKHVILPDAKLEQNLLYYKISTYTATPEQASAWLKAAKRAIEMIGNHTKGTYEPDEKEVSTLRTMTRGVYAKRDIPKGAFVKRSDVYFAIPHEKGALAAGEWKGVLLADRSYKKDAALSSRAQKKRS